MAAEKIVAIYSNHQNLKNVIEALNNSGLEHGDISVLVKRQPDESTGHLSDDVRTYSTATYPETRVVGEYNKPERHDTGAYATQTGERVLDTLPIMSPGMTGATVGGGENIVPTLENTETALPSQQTQDTSVVDTNRLDRNITEHSDVAVKDPNALKKDAFAGGALGLLAGAAALLIPGVGPVLAAGPIAAAVGAMAAGAALGTTAGAVVGLFKDEGIPNERVDFYRQAFEDGKGIVIVKVKDEDAGTFTLAQDILNQHYPELVERIA